MHDYEKYDVKIIKEMMRGIGIVSSYWPARKKQMIIKLRNWDATHPHDIAANKRVAAWGLARVGTGPTLAPDPATTPAKPKDSRKRKQSSPLVEKGARPKRQKKNESIDDSSDVEDILPTAKPKVMLRIRLPKPSSTTGLNTAGLSLQSSTSIRHEEDDNDFVSEVDETESASLLSKSTRHNLSIIPEEEEDEDDDEGATRQASENKSNVPRTHPMTVIKSGQKPAASKITSKEHVQEQSSAQAIARSLTREVSAATSQSTSSKEDMIEKSLVRPAARGMSAATSQSTSSKLDMIEKSLVQPAAREKDRGNGKEDGEEVALPQEDYDEDQENSDEGSVDGASDPEDLEEEPVSAPIKRSSRATSRSKSRKSPAGTKDNAPPAKEIDDPVVAEACRVRNRTIKLNMDNDIPAGMERAPMEHLGSWRQEERMMEEAKKAGREVKVWMGEDLDVGEYDRSASPMEYAFPPK